MESRNGPRRGGRCDNVGPHTRPAARGTLSFSFTTAAVGAVLSLLATIGLIFAPVSAAHSDLTSSTPISGATLESSPAEVALVFNEEIARTGLPVVAQDPAGSVPLGTPVVSGTTVTSLWPQDAGGGDFRVSYRVVSADGHPIDGTITFTVAGTAAVASPSASAASSGASSGAGEPTAADSTETSSGAHGSSSFPLWVPAVVVVVGVVIGATIARTLRTRRSAQTSDSASTTPDAL